MNPITELRSHLDFFSGRCLNARWFGARLHVAVAQDIVEDEVAVHEAIAHDAYTAEQEDRIAAKLIQDAIADGLVTPEEMKKLKEAVRQIYRSAEQDRKISEMAKV